MKNFKVELYNLQAIIVMELNKRADRGEIDFQENGQIKESDLNQDNYHAWDVPVIEYDNKKEESYEHSIEAVLQEDGSYNVDLRLSY